MIVPCLKYFLKKIRVNLHNKDQYFMSEPSKRLRINIMIADRRASISIEKEAWAALTEIARRREMSVDELVGEIDAVRGDVSRASAMRIYILDFFRGLTTVIKSRSGNAAS